MINEYRLSLSDLIKQTPLQNIRISCLALVDDDNIKIVDDISKVNNLSCYYPVNKSLVECAELSKKYSINLIISQVKYNYLANKLLWAEKGISASIYLDTDNPYQTEEQSNMLMNKKLWDAVAITSSNEIEAGGWINSYSRKYFTKEEMNEFTENVYKKVKDILGEGKRKNVLEIGCASGLTMFNLLPYVSKYVAIDISKINIQKNHEKAIRLNIDNLKLCVLSADRLLELDDNNFDLIIINSVVQCFPGINYLRSVIESAVIKLKEYSFIFIGDVMDLDKKDLLLSTLINYKNKYPDYDTKIDWSEELFLNKDYFRDITKTISGIKSVSFSDKIGKIQNELTKFRYDVLFTIDKTSYLKSTSAVLNKYQFAKKIF